MSKEAVQLSLPGFEQAFGGWRADYSRQIGTDRVIKNRSRIDQKARRLLDWKTIGLGIFLTFMVCPAWLVPEKDQAFWMTKIAAATLLATGFRAAKLQEAAQDPGLVATELADYLVGSGVPFREAHEIVGKVLRAAEQDGKSIRHMPLERLKEFSPAFGDNIAGALTIESALARKAAAGGTAPDTVRGAIEDFKARVAKLGGGA